MQLAYNFLVINITPSFESQSRCTNFNGFC